MKIRLVQGDITEIKVDAIVNAANSSLMGGGGVDGAIHRKGGRAILEGCMEIRNRQGGCRTGEAVITSAGNLPAKFVIHTVGPVWQGGGKGESELLRNCYFNSLELASENSVASIAFPNISTGIYRYPKAAAAEVAVEAVRDYLRSNGTLEELQFVCFDKENYEIYQELLTAE